ncbi:hypothetical protein QC760_006409 [Botrytis cinerea]
MHQDDTSVAEGNSVDDIPEDPEPTTELSHPKHGTKNFSRANPSDTTHSPSKANRISKHATFLNTPNDYIIPIIHTQTPQFLTNNPGESSPNTTSESLETRDTPDNPEDTLEETPHHLTIYTSYDSTHKLFLKSTIDWNGLAQAHYTPEIETITTFLDHNEHYPHLYPSEPLLPNTTESHSSTLQTFFNSLEKSFPNSDFPTLQKAIDVLALEQGKTATNGAPSFVLLYALRAQIWYSGVTMRDAWVKFQDHGAAAYLFRGLRMESSLCDVQCASGCADWPVQVQEVDCAGRGREIKITGSETHGEDQEDTEEAGAKDGSADHAEEFLWGV